jgi:uncharacterized protein YabE (DUF348 family)
VAAGSALHKTVSVSVDGQSFQASAFALTVSDVLHANGVALAPEDEVSPAADSPAVDGQEIEVRFVKPVTLVIDGREVTFNTHDAVLGDALDDIPVGRIENIADLGAAKFSVAHSAVLPRTGMKVRVTTPKEISFTVGGEPSTITTHAETVAALLDEQGLTMGDDDRLNQGLDERVAAGDEIVLDRVEVTTEERKEAIAFETEKRQNAKLWLGESRVVTTGSKGAATRVYQVTKVNGEADSERMVLETVTKKPKTQVVEQGTKKSANGVGINLARAAQWDKIAKCESTSNWSINTGNGYYGGLQFSRSSWVSNGGRDFAALPHQATRAQQITVANRYYAKAGYRPWGCRHVLG